MQIQLLVPPKLLRKWSDCVRCCTLYHVKPGSLEHAAAAKEPRKYKKARRYQHDEMSPARRAPHPRYLTLAAS
jgi:hypothetical protein